VCYAQRRQSAEESADLAIVDGLLLGLSALLLHAVERGFALEFLAFGQGLPRPIKAVSASAS
jgi:hypothetical protein